jgi:menaquinone-specific isochorismate synthase
MYPKFYIQDPPILALGCQKECSEEEASLSNDLHISISDFNGKTRVYKPEKIIPPNLPQSPTSPLLLESKLDLSYEEYNRKCSSLISLLGDNFQKVVFATRATALYSSPINPFDLLASLPKDPNVCLFAYIPSKERAFVGASPEILYERKENQIKSHALAKTVSYDQSIDLKSDLEFTLVFDFIKKILEYLCVNITISDVYEKHLKWVKHLCSDFFGTLKEGILDSEITKLLHPTPALCGSPRDAAFSWIKENEGFERGYYGAPLGIVSRNFTKKIVAIRSSLIEGCKLTAFAGSGIIKTSDPALEFLEIKKKLALWGLKI